MFTNGAGSAISEPARLILIPTPAIERAVMLSWPADGVLYHVLRADAVDGPWTPTWVILRWEDWG